MRNSARIHELVIAPLEAQWEDEVPNFDVRSSFRPFLCEAQAVLTNVLQAIRKIMRETMAVLPTLYHVENSVSTHGPERTAMAYQKIWDEMGIDLSGNFPTVTNDQSDTLGRGVSYLMTSPTISITSLKLREVPFENWLYHWRIPDQVVHLDIELRISQEIGNSRGPSTNVLRRARLAETVHGPQASRDAAAQSLMRGVVPQRGRVVRNGRTPSVLR